MKSVLLMTVMFVALGFAVTGCPGDEDNDVPEPDADSDTDSDADGDSDADSDSDSDGIPACPVDDDGNWETADFVCTDMESCKLEFMGTPDENYACPGEGDVCCSRAEEELPACPEEDGYQCVYEYDSCEEYDNSSLSEEYTCPDEGLCCYW